MLYRLLLLSQVCVIAEARRFPLLGTQLWGRPSLTTQRVASTNPLLSLRCGYQDDDNDDGEEMSLDEKVHAAMRKLGLEQPDATNDECEGGVCPVPATTAAAADGEHRITEGSLVECAAEIAKSMNVDKSLAMAALGATVARGANNERTYSETAARAMIQYELDLIETIPEDSEQVQQLVSEGNDSFMSRRALAFAEMNMEDARAILLADAEDEREANEAEAAHQQQLQQTEAPPVKTEPFKTVAVDANFDPTKIGTEGAAAAPPTPTGAPKPAKKSDVVFEATTAQIQELVLESPVPVLLDVYADWCGPCKALTPVLEDMAVKSGGMFRLVKVNSDNEKPVSAALGVEALPSVFGFRDGKILHMFKGMPRSEEAMKNFMMGLLMPGAKFTPAVTESEKKTYDEMTSKLVKVAGAACFPFSARERLQDRVSTNLDKLVQETGDASRAEESAMVMRALFSNIIKNPYDQKFRTANLTNQKIAAKVASFPAALAMMKSVGFARSADGNSMTLCKGKKLVNVAPLMVARDSIDKWVDQSRYEIAKAARQRKDEEARARLEAEGYFDKDEEEEVEVEEKVVDMDACQLKVRMEGKKKVHEMSFSADDPVESILDQLPSKLSDDEEVQITCVAKRLVLKSTQEGSFRKTFRELGLSPSAAVVVGIGGPKAKEATSTKLAEKAALKKRKKGSHTMQSVGIYSKDDNNKAELIDGGGGTWYEHDVSDDEEETKDEETSEVNEQEAEEEEGEED